MKIWYQSYVDYENGKSYWDELQTHLTIQKTQIRKLI